MDGRGTPQDLSATPRPEDAGKAVGFEKPKEDQEFVGHKMLNVCGGFGKLALITQDGRIVQVQLSTSLSLLFCLSFLLASTYLCVTCDAVT